MVETRRKIPVLEITKLMVDHRIARISGYAVSLVENDSAMSLSLAMLSANLGRIKASPGII